MNHKYSLQDPIEKSHTGIVLMAKQLECLMGQKLEKLMQWQLLNLENISFLEVKTKESNCGIMMKESAISKESDIQGILLKFKFHQTKRH
jgi:hypothetical protein